MMVARPLALVGEYREMAPRLEAHIRRLGDSLRILEAGCGHQWPLKLSGMSVDLTGVDLDAASIGMRRDLRRAVVGDLRDTGLFARGSYDVIYSSFVLEHVDGAEQVLDNFMTWLRPGGLLILRVPDRDSVYGFTARVTPFWMHVLYKRWIEGMPNAGKPGFDPYPTRYDHVVSRRGVQEFCRRNGCRVMDEYGMGFYLRGRLGVLRKLAAVMLWALSFGRLAWRHNNLTFVIENARSYDSMSEIAVGEAVEQALAR